MKLAVNAAHPHRAIGPAKGISETDSAADAPLIARISGSFSPSALSKIEMICVS